MPIYKYVSPDTGLKYLGGWRLRYTRPADLNDPFEIDLRVRASVSTAAPNARSPATEEIRRQLAGLGRMVEDLQSGLAATAANDIAILCFTRTRRHLLMWGHYAVSHSGMLLEFDETHACFRRDAGEHPLADICGKVGDVVYSDDRPSIPTLDADSVRRAAHTKSLEWAYEQEVRLLWPLTLADHYADANGQVALLDVPPAAMRSITFGHYCTPQTRAGAEAILTREASHVTRFQAVPNRDEFRLDYKPCV